MDGDHLTRSERVRSESAVCTSSVVLEYAILSTPLYVVHRSNVMLVPSLAAACPRIHLLRLCAPLAPARIGVWFWSPGSVYDSLRSVSFPARPHSTSSLSGPHTVFSSSSRSLFIYNLNHRQVCRSVLNQKYQLSLLGWETPFVTCFSKC